MSFVYWFQVSGRDPESPLELPDPYSDLVDYEHSGLSYFVFPPEGIIKGIVVTREHVDTSRLKDVLGADVVELIREGELGPGSVLVDREGVRIQLAE